MVGVNEFVHEDDEQIPILRIDPELERKQVGRVEATRAARDAGRHERSLEALKQAAADPTANLMHLILECSRARATVGGIIAALQTEFGTYTESPVY